MLTDLFDAWTAANACDSEGTKKFSKRLGIRTYLGYFNKPELTLLDPDWAKKLDNGVWVNHPLGKPLTKEQIQEELNLTNPGR